MPSPDTALPTHGIAHADAELRRWSRAALLTVLVAAGVLGGWSVLAPLDSAVVARGLVKVEDYRQIVQHRDGGLVKRILVKNGSHVTKGQPLLELEDSRVDATADLLGQQLEAEQARQTRLQAERDFTPELAFPPGLLARQAEPAVAALLASERSLFDQRRRTLSLQVDILQKQVAEVARELAASQQQIEADTAALATAQAEHKANADLLQQGFVSPTRLLALQRTVADYQARLAEHRAEHSRSQQKQNDLRLKIEETRNAYRQAAVAELKETTLRANDLQQQVKPAEDTLRRQVVLAPADGEVVNLKVHTLGATIGPREALMEIVPRNQRLLAEVKLPVDTISDLKEGMAAQVRLLAFQARSTPLVPGQLAYLAADAIADANGEVYYLGQISLDPGAIADAALPQLQPGMPVEVHLPTHPRRAIDYVLDPIRLSFHRAFREK